jgi:hypothetical protein
MRYFATFYGFLRGSAFTMGTLLTTNELGKTPSLDFLIDYVSQKYKIHTSLVNIKDIVEVSEEEFSRLQKINK